MTTKILFTGRNENGVYHQSEDSQTYISRETGVITHEGSVIGELTGKTRKATIDDINKAIKDNVSFQLSIESHKYWHDKKLEVS